MESAPVVGTWDVLSWEHEFPSGEKVLLLGEDPKGRLIYDPNGQMSVLIAAKSRPGIGWRFSSFTPEEKAEAYDGIFGYSGKYEVIGTEIVHHVEVSTVPVMAGQDLRRTFSRQGSELQLSYVGPNGSGRLTCRQIE